MYAGYVFHTGKQGGTTEKTLKPYFDLSDRIFDVGVGYNYAFTNDTTEPVQGYYALLTYKPETLGTGYPSAQFHSFDLNLTPGQSVSDILLSAFYDLSNAKCIWIAFESKEKQNQFFRVPELDSQYSYYTVNSEQWLRDNFGIK